MEDLQKFFTLTKWLFALLYLSAATDIVAVISGVAEYRLIDDMAGGGTPAYDIVAAADSSDTRQAAIGIAQILIWIATTIVAAVWIRRANINARALGAADMEFSPNWAIGWYFVPIANLWKPYQAMTEIWCASSGAMNWEEEEPDGVFKLWWGLWLAATIAAQASFRLSMRATTLDDFSLVNRMTIASDGLSVLLAFAFIAVVEEIRDRQKSRVAFARPDVQPRSAG